LGKILRISINPIIYRLGIKTEWFSKFINNKNSDLDNSNHSVAEVVYFVNLFFKKYGLQIDGLKLYYTKYNLKLFIIFNPIAISYKRSSFPIKLKKNKCVSFKCLLINNYLKYKHLAVLLNNIGNNNSKLLDKTLLYNRLNMVVIIGLLRLKHLNLKQNFFINLFINKFTVIVKLFSDYKKSVTTIFKQLSRNTDSNMFYLIRKHHLIFNIIRLRKFDQLVSYRTVFNLIYSSIKLKNKTVVLSNVLSLKLLSIKNLKHIGIFLKYIETLCILLLLRPGFVLGLKAVLTGNIYKNQRATQFILAIGQCINNSKINQNVGYNKSTCFTANGTLGIKVYIKS
jgi:hypothetical protein